jgi:signal transduction histidine kinase
VKGLFFLYSLLLFFCLLQPVNNFAQPVISISSTKPVLNIPAQNILWLTDETGSMQIDDVKNKGANAFTANLISTNKQQVYWVSFQLQNLGDVDQEYILRTPKLGHVDLYIMKSDSGFEKLQTGSLLPLRLRSEPSSFNCLQFLLLKNERRICWLRIAPVYSLYVPKDFSLQVMPQNLFEEQDRKRLFWQGMFLGIILVMALYNLFLLFAVKDISYLYYVISFVSLGFYFAFYYGIGIEYLWPSSPVWDTFCYTMLVPLTGLARILFTRTYLHTPVLLPRINIILNVLIGFTLITLLTATAGYIFKIDMLANLIGVIGVLGTVILIMMLVAGISAYYQKNYEPAKYFIVANIVLVIGAIAFIIRELGFAGDNFFTRYFVQYGVLIQMVVFSLGLASRLNRTRLQLTQETLEKERLALDKEREKKEMMEQQSQQLQQQVKEKTIDLQQKNDMLEQTIEQVKDSENKLSQLNQVKDKLFSIVSHDLRNPLATMQSFLKLITEHHDKLNEEEKIKLFSEAKQSIDNLDELLYNLLQWSKSQMNLLQFRPEKVNMNTVIENCIRMLKLNAHMKSVRIHAAAAPDSYAYVDKEMMEFILRNLLSNAIKFSHRDSNVFIEVISIGQELSIQVKDNGIGMNASRSRKLEEMTGTFSRRGTEKEKGTGLGLLISKEFIQKNNGRLEIESQLGKGSVFAVIVPKEPGGN